MMNCEDKGFSLIEVLVAVAILAITSVAVLRYFSQNLYALGKSTSSIKYSYNLKFFFTEAIRKRNLPTGAEDYEGGDSFKFEDSRFSYEFDFEDAPFVEDYDVRLLNLTAKKINIKVIDKQSGKIVYEGEAYHLFKKRR